MKHYVKPIVKYTGSTTRCKSLCHVTPLENKTKNKLRVISISYTQQKKFLDTSKGQIFPEMFHIGCLLHFYT